MNKILITGASGFVGKNIIPYLKNLNIDLVTTSRKELASNISFKNEDAIIHLAGKAHDIKKISDPDEYYSVNYELTKKLYDAFLNSSAKKFIFMSSVKAAADSLENVLDECIIPSPQTHYGKSKLMAEQYIQGQPLPDGKAYYILRPCMIHGPDNKGNLNLLYKLVRKGIPYPLAAFENKRSFLSVQNLCFVIKNILEREIMSGIYNIADDESLSTNEVVSILAKSINKKPKLWKISPKWIRCIARFSDQFKLPLTTERLNKLTENYVVNNSKIKQALGVNLPLSSKDGLKITAYSFGNSSKE